MKAYERHAGMYHFKYLPAFAKFILENHLNEFVREQIDWSFEFKLPLLRFFTHLTPEQIFETSKKNNAELLSVLAENKAKEYIENSLRKWTTNKHELVEQSNIAVDDITLLNHIRQKGLQKWIYQYTTVQEEIIGLHDEIANYTFANNTAGADTYINILTERLERKSEQLLEAQSIAQVGSFEWDFINTSRDNSPELRKIFETNEPQSYEQLREKIHPDDKEKVTQALQESMSTGNFDCEYRYLVNNKEKVLWTRGIVHYKDGKPALMTGTVQDVSERKKIEQNLLLKTFELELSNSNLEKFAYVASHDLQEPLRKILMHTDLLLISEKDQFSPKGKELIEKISSSAAKLKNLIKDILTYSTINPEKAKETVDLGTLLKEVTVDLEYSISKNNATIHFDHLPSASVFPSQIKQLFQNLISNSVKFSKKETPPVITIRHKFISAAKVAGYQIIPASKFLQIEVTDNGIGFNKDESQEIFSLFKRLHSQKEFEGSGLGLAICKKVVENHGGIIEAVSKAGEGANFRIILPQ